MEDEKVRLWWRNSLTEVLRERAVIIEELHKQDVPGASALEDALTSQLANTLITDYLRCNIAYTQAGELRDCFINLREMLKADGYSEAQATYICLCLLGNMKPSHFINQEPRG